MNKKALPTYQKYVGAPPLSPTEKKMDFWVDA